MKPEAEQFMRKARDPLAEAEVLKAIPPSGSASRTAHLAGFHAARALLFELGSRVVETLRGVHTKWQRGTRGDAEVDEQLRGFLSRSFRFKVTADCGLDPLDRVTEEQAATAIMTAKRWLDVVDAKLSVAP